jgi:hypothetical protein
MARDFSGNFYVAYNEAPADRAAVDALPAPPAVDERVSVTRVYLNQCGYTSRGEYFGAGAPLYFAQNDADTISYHLRAHDRADALARILSQYPGAVFFRGAGGGR